MDFLRYARCGDVFQWCHPFSPQDYCEITRIHDEELQVDFIYLTGMLKGQRGYTMLPQPVMHVTDAITLLGLSLDE